MQAYIDKIKESVHKLAVSQTAIDDEEIVFHTLRGLSIVFNSFKTTMRTRIEPVSFDELISLMNAKDNRVGKDQTGNSVTADSTIAFVASVGTANVQQSCTGDDGVMIGNSSKLPVAHSGKGLLSTTPPSFVLSNLLHDNQTNRVLHQGPYLQGLHPLHHPSRQFSHIAQFSPKSIVAQKAWSP
ncbi:hypothetical protein Acr_18g0005860 [Actinidia rufa]|uniref:Retrovirus-related Pol polyprotein from transposon TNT 1-94 n=1 Tax=Actinidia rufa TaxID=165716 RepID=A0A7J0G6K2_9ERIC|nr:hypothetical protein Acr_18g0005860 [Actinidia rufa]